MKKVPWQALCTAILFFVADGLAQAKLKALIIDGQNNHPWKRTTPVLKHILDDSGVFTTDVATSPAKGQAINTFKPEFAKYDVIVLNYRGADWPRPTQESFVNYVKGGGGVVVFHNANNAFPNWDEYNDMIGLGGWGSRTEKHGPMVRWRNGKTVLDYSPKKGGPHGEMHQFVITVRDSNHPIMKGLPEKWLHVEDELYAKLRGPAKNLTLLATAYCDPNTKNGTGENEPVLFTVNYGKGRIFQTTLGHDTEQMCSVDFIVTLQRGVQWAASGEVDQPVPCNFPSQNKVCTRSFAASDRKQPIAANDPNVRN